MSAIGMPGHLLALFAARPPLERVPAVKHNPLKPYTGMSDFASKFETVKPPPVEPFEPPKARKERLKLEHAAKVAEELKARIAEYVPQQDPEKVKTADPRKTLFVGRLSYETTEKKLLKTFEAYGPVRDIRLVSDKEGKPRGYAFVEFRSSESLRSAYRDTMDKNLDGRRIVVDMERARTVNGWLPRRLGGGEGPPRVGISKKVLQQRAMERRTMANNLGPERPMMRGGTGGPRRGTGRGGPWRDSGNRDGYEQRGHHHGGSANDGTSRNYDRGGDRPDRSSRGGGGDRSGGYHDRHGGPYSGARYGSARDSGAPRTYGGDRRPPSNSQQLDSVTGANNIPIGRSVRPPPA